MMKKMLSVLVMASVVIATAFAAPAVVRAEEVQQPTVEEAPPVELGPPAKIVVNRDENHCWVYDKKEQLIKEFVVSTGKKGHRTPLGTFKVYEHVAKGDYHLMNDGTYGKWCMRWRKGGYLFHTVCYAKYGDPEPIEQEVKDLGKNVSLGCVRLAPADAEWLYKNTANGCTVIITENPKNQEPAKTDCAAK